MPKFVRLTRINPKSPETHPVYINVKHILGISFGPYRIVEQVPGGVGVWETTCTVVNAAKGSLIFECPVKESLDVVLSLIEKAKAGELTLP